MSASRWFRTPSLACVCCWPQNEKRFCCGLVFMIAAVGFARRGGGEWPLLAGLWKQEASTGDGVGDNLKYKTSILIFATPVWTQRRGIFHPAAEPALVGSRKIGRRSARFTIWRSSLARFFGLICLKSRTKCRLHLSDFIS